jgi:biopolymer transport protein ExbB/TolQ
MSKLYLTYFTINSKTEYYYLFYFLLVVIVVVAVVYYVITTSTKARINDAAWKTLKANHPDLEKLFRKHANNPNFFASVDALMRVEDIENFNILISEFTTSYPDFNNHMQSLQLSNAETFKKFEKHRYLAKIVFDSLK